jgi:hypothetical protein
VVPAASQHAPGILAQIVPSAQIARDAYESSCGDHEKDTFGWQMGCASTAAVIAHGLGNYTARLTFEPAVDAGARTDC